MKDGTAAWVGTSFPATRLEFTDITRDPDGRLVYLATKRAIDLIFAAMAMPILAVLTMVLFAANRIWNPGPIFFRQKRMGRNGKPFVMWKFRTMTEDGAGLRACDAPLDAHRITPLGRLLRRTKLDELPNILNILMGDMSLVGPRPDAFEHAAVYLVGIAHYRNRFSVRPGITGLAQIRGGYADNRRSVIRKAAYDRFYIKNSSLRLEIYIILKTCAVVFSGFGQR